jgi:hypothetical protein
MAIGSGRKAIVGGRSLISGMTHDDLIIVIAVIPIAGRGFASAPLGLDLSQPLLDIGQRLADVRLMAVQRFDRYWRRIEGFVWRCGIKHRCLSAQDAAVAPTRDRDLLNQFKLVDPGGLPDFDEPSQKVLEFPWVLIGEQVFLRRETVG